MIPLYIKAGVVLLFLKMKRLISFYLFACLVTDSFAVSAYPLPVPLTVGRQTYYVRLFGDEHRKWAETSDGYTLLRDTLGRWCYAQTAADLSLAPSPWTLGNERQQDVAAFLSQVPKHLVPIAPSKRKVARTAKTTTNDGQPANRQPVVGERRVLVILMSYQDRLFTKSNTDYDRLFNEEGYSDDQAHGSVRDYYLDVSYRQLDLRSDIYGPYITKEKMSYYGKNGRDHSDSNPYALFVEAIAHVAAETDLSKYDGDGDGFVDNVHIIFAGYGEESGAPADAIWSHESTFYRPYEVQGLKIDRYSCAPELRGNSGNGISRIGPHCHEIGHALGAMDFYDTNYTIAGQFQGTGQWDVMAQGSWNNDGVTPADFNPYVKAYNYGWVTPRPLPTGEVTLEPSCSGADTYYLLKASEYGDYYLLENRSQQGWGSALPGEGLLLFHVHADIANAGNEINVGTPQMCYVVCASSTAKQPGRNAASYGDINSDGCPFPGSNGNTVFSSTSTPQAFFWDGSNCQINLNGISLSDDGLVTLNNSSSGVDYEPRQWRQLFFEGFEDQLQVDDIANSQWTIEENPENTMTILNRPIAYEGLRSLQLTSGEEGVDIADTITFSCEPAGGTLRLKVSAVAMRPLLISPNTFTVGYRRKDNPEWYYSEAFQTEKTRWRQYFVNLPDNIDGTFRIIGSAYGGSILAIDHIEVEQTIEKDVDSAMKLPFTVFAQSASFSETHIYTLTGQRRQRVGRGLNLITNGKTT